MEEIDEKEDTYSLNGERGKEERKRGVVRGKKKEEKKIVEEKKRKEEKKRDLKCQENRVEALLVEEDCIPSKVGWERGNKWNLKKKEIEFG